MLTKNLRDTVKWWLFPGTNLNARLRYRMIGNMLGKPNSNGPLEVLDAGCGNGALAYWSYRLGNRVLGVSIKDEVARNQRLFNDRLRIPTDRLEFRDLNLYDVDQLGKNRFDEIICTEVLEHIRGDAEVAKKFFTVLKPEGVLHLCCPNAQHRYHRVYPLDPDETGGHVRSGYTEESYRELLEPIGFRVLPAIGVGGQWRHRGNEWIRAIESVAGVPAGVLGFAFVAPVAWFDSATPKTPFSLYVQAKKPAA